MDSIITTSLDADLGASLSFKNEPIKRAVIASTFDNVPSLKTLIEREVFSLLREALEVILPRILHEKSLAWIQERRQQEDHQRKEPSKVIVNDSAIDLSDNLNNNLVKQKLFHSKEGILSRHYPVIVGAGEKSCISSILMSFQGPNNNDQISSHSSRPRRYSVGSSTEGIKSSSSFVQKASTALLSPSLSYSILPQIRTFTHLVSPLVISTNVNGSNNGQNPLSCYGSPNGSFELSHACPLYKTDPSVGKMRRLLQMQCTLSPYTLSIPHTALRSRLASSHHNINSTNNNSTNNNSNNVSLKSSASSSSSASSLSPLSYSLDGEYQKDDSSPSIAANEMGPAKMNLKRLHRFKNLKIN